jgi:hypothetical protein
MGIPSIKKPGLVLGAGVLLPGLLAAYFWFRPPVLFVTDTPFTTLYGLRRARIQGLKTTLKLMRRIKPVLIGENAGTDMVLFAVEEAHKAPYAVLFPDRYYEGAQRYIAQFPQVPVFILGARNQDPQLPGAIFLGTDTALDLYRAGLCAGILAQHTSSPDEATRPSEDILFFQNQGLSGEYQEAFNRGLREQGFTKEPKYINAGEDYADTIHNISCVVMQGQGASFLEGMPEVPVILFSWVDPALTSGAVTLVADDSPWAAAADIKALIPRRQGGLVPSDWVFPRQRTMDKELLSRLKKALVKRML